MCFCRAQTLAKSGHDNTEGEFLRSFATSLMVINCPCMDYLRAQEGAIEELLIRPVGCQKAFTIKQRLL